MDTETTARFDSEGPRGTNASTKFKPPYMAFATFWSFVEQLAEKPLPPRIDRSLMSSKSGTDQQNLLSAFRALDLIDEESRVHALKDLAVNDPDARTAQLAALLKAHYPGPVAVSEQDGTEAQLSEAFRDDYDLSAAETRRKAQTFFLHAMHEAGLKLSANFPQTRRSGSGAPGAPKPKVTKAATPKKTTPPPDPVVRTGKGDAHTVELNSGGTVTVDVSVNLWDLSVEDRTFVITLVDALKGYEIAPKPQEEAPTQ